MKRQKKIYIHQYIVKQFAGVLESTHRFIGRKIEVAQPFVLHCIRVQIGMLFLFFCCSRLLTLFALIQATLTTTTVETQTNKTIPNKYIKLIKCNTRWDRIKPPPNLYLKWCESEQINILALALQNAKRVCICRH